MRHHPDSDTIRRMFAGIAPRYDLLNTILSLGRHQAWRRVAVRLAAPPPGGKALDVCCGTGDLTRLLARHCGARGLTVGVDFCTPMLETAESRRKRNDGTLVAYAAADAHVLPFSSGAFDCATIAFGIRNVARPREVFAEMARVVRPGGRVVCLEFGLPPDRFRAALVRLYECYVVPTVGGWLSQREAYEYLRDSIKAFARPEDVRGMMASAGLSSVRTTAMHASSVYAHVGTKP